MSLLSRQQHFTDPWVGHTGLNRMGLHLLRLGVASACYTLRRRLHRHADCTFALRDFQRNGFVVIPDFLPATAFDSLQQRVREHTAMVDKAQPVRSYGEHGFGAKHFFTGGFDRFDGGTLNRFYQLPANDAAMELFVASAKLQQLVATLTGTSFKAERCLLYKVRHGDEQHNPDIQKDWHRDTFQPAMKFWYFTEQVTAKQGPFEYIPGSHKLTLKRLRWEYQQSVQASRQKAGGAFRMDEAEVCAMYQCSPVRCEVPANSLVLADVRGFHRRSHAEVGSERVSFYANFRPHPLRCW